MRPIATASMNCCSVSQCCSSTSPECRNGTIARPDANVNAPALRKNTPSVPSEALEPVHAKPWTVARVPAGETLASPLPGRGRPPP